MAVWGSGGVHEFEKGVRGESVRVMGGYYDKGGAGGVREYNR